VSLPWWARTLTGRPRRPARYELVAVEKGRYDRCHVCLYRFLVWEWLVTIVEPAAEGEIDDIDENPDRVAAVDVPSDSRGVDDVDEFDADGPVEVSRYWRVLESGSDDFDLLVIHWRRHLGMLVAERGEL
jgi:hypothetical protein